MIWLELYGLTAAAGTTFCQLVRTWVKVYFRSCFSILLCRREGVYTVLSSYFVDDYYLINAFKGMLVFTGLRGFAMSSNARSFQPGS